MKISSADLREINPHREKEGIEVISKYSKIRWASTTNENHYKNHKFYKPSECKTESSRTCYMAALTTKNNTVNNLNTKCPKCKQRKAQKSKV